LQSIASSLVSQLRFSSQNEIAAVAAHDDSFDALDMRSVAAERATNCKIAR